MKIRKTYTKLNSSIDTVPANLHDEIANRYARISAKDNLKLENTEIQELLVRIQKQSIATTNCIDSIVTEILAIQNEHAQNNRSIEPVNEVMIIEKNASHLRVTLGSTNSFFSEAFDKEGLRKLFKKDSIDEYKSRIPLEYPVDFKENDSFTLWEDRLFHNMPIAPALTLLNKLRQDVLRSELHALDFLLNEIPVIRN